MPFYVRLPDSSICSVLINTVGCHGSFKNRSPAISLPSRAQRSFWGASKACCGASVWKHNRCLERLRSAVMPGEIKLRAPGRATSCLGCIANRIWWRFPWANSSPLGPNQFARLAGLGSVSNVALIKRLSLARGLFHRSPRPTGLGRMPSQLSTGLADIG